MARSLLAITNHDGFVFQAAVVTAAPKAAPFVGPCGAVSTSFSVFGKSCAKSSAIPFGVIDRNPCASGRSSAPSGAGGYGLLILTTDSPSPGAKAAT